MKQRHLHQRTYSMEKGLRGTDSWQREICVQSPYQHDFMIYVVSFLSSAVFYYLPARSLQIILHLALIHSLYIGTTCPVLAQRKKYPKVKRP